MASDEEVYLFFNGVKYGPCTKAAVLSMTLPEGAMIKLGDGAWQWPDSVEWLKKQKE